MQFIVPTHSSVANIPDKNSPDFYDNKFAATQKYRINCLFIIWEELYRKKKLMWILWLIILLQHILTSCVFKLLNNCSNNRYRHWPQQHPHWQLGGNRRPCYNFLISSRKDPICCVWTFTDRDLWRAVCQRRGTRPALCPHGAGNGWHPWVAARRRNPEQVRGSKPSSTGICAHLHLYEKMTLCLFYVTDETALFLPIINKEKHTRPRCLTWVKTKHTVKMSLF